MPFADSPHDVHILPHGTRRYSPNDLIAYLEGDFAAWCERFQAPNEAAFRPRSSGYKAP
jgi:hypothetical protein